jgi:hypothetical protein
LNSDATSLIVIRSVDEALLSVGKYLRLEVSRALLLRDQSGVHPNQ